MRRRGTLAAFLLALCALGIPPEAQSANAPRVCDLYRDAYQNEIGAKIKAGIPFELMGAWFDDGELKSKKVVHISFNLWDEIVTVKSGTETLGRFAFKDGATELCKYLDVSDAENTDLKPGRRYVFRLLLNPMWGERMARLQVSSGRELSGQKVLGIDWKKLAAEMPSDQVLLEKEVKP